MADVRGSERSRTSGRACRDRAQLFLVGAIVLAVLLVALAVLLNAVIYTGNLATRDTGADVAATIEYDDAAHDAAFEVFTATNDYADENEANHTRLEANLTGGIGAWETASAEHAAIRGTMASIENVVVTNGTRIEHDSTTGENFYPVDDNSTTEWTLADPTRVRNYTINAEPINETDEGALDPTDPANVTDTFFLELDGADTYYVYLFRDTSGEGCVIVHDATNQFDRECVSETEFVVDLTADPANGTATIAPASSPGSTETFDASFFEDVGPDHSVTYHNPGEMNGTYGLTIDSRLDGPDVDANRFNEDRTVDEDPTAWDAIYDLEYDVVRRSDSLHYRNGTRIAPEEAPYDAS
jgi:uncharacterized protein (UPF0333 family)